MHAHSIDDHRFDVPLRGLDVDAATRCAHWQGPRDVVAYRFACCNTFYPCYECHRATTDHVGTPWPQERLHEPAVLCGVCRTVLTARAYLDCNHTCPACGAAFNPGCRVHWHRYFAL